MTPTRLREETALKQEVDDDGDTSNGDEPVERVVLAANRLSITPRAPSADARNERAGEADKDVEVLDDDAEQTEEETNGALVGGLLNAVAALDGVGVAVPARSGLARRSGCGSGSSGSDGFGFGVSALVLSRDSGSEECADKRRVEEGEHRGGGELHGDELGIGRLSSCRCCRSEVRRAGVKC